MEDKNKNTILALGLIGGAITGLAAAYIFIKQSESSVQETSLSPRHGLKLGMGVFTLLRLVSDLNKE